MEKHHNFLYELFRQDKGYRNNRFLDASSPAEIWVLLRILHCIREGHIDLKKAYHKKLIQSKRENLLLNANYKKLLKGPSTHEDRIRFVKKFSSLYKYLLHSIFVHE